MADVTNYTTMDLANMILTEKTNKITPENIRHDVQIFDIVGNYKGDTGAAYAPRRIQFTGIGLNRANSQNSAYITNPNYEGRNLDIFDVEHLDVSNATNIDYSFYCTRYINTLRGLANWDTTHFTDLCNGFIYLSNLTNVDELANWNVSNVTNMANTFMGCSNISDWNGVANWDTSHVVNMYNTFCGCSNMRDLSALDNWSFDNKYFGNTFMGTNISNFGNNRTIYNTTFGNTFSPNTNFMELNKWYFNECSLYAISGFSYTKSMGNNMNFLLQGENVSINGMFISDRYGPNNNSYSWKYNIYNTGNYNIINGSASSTFAGQMDLNNVQNIYITNCSTTESMFSYCKNITSAGNMNIHFSTTTDKLSLNYMFYFCNNLVDTTCMENWTFTDRSPQIRYVQVSSMFYGCSNLSDNSLYAITNFLLLIAPNVYNSQYVNGLNLSNLCSNAIFTGTNIQINQRLNNYQLNRLYMAGYRGFGTY